MWMTVEAKSAQHPDGLLPLHDIRQANTQLDQLAVDRGMDRPHAGSPAVIVSDRLTVDRRTRELRTQTRTWRPAA
jgi:hypothetical protein